MDFQSAMETFAEAWVAANTQTPLTEAAETQALGLNSSVLPGGGCLDERREKVEGSLPADSSLRRPGQSSTPLPLVEFRHVMKMSTTQQTGRSIPVHCIVEQITPQGQTVDLSPTAIDLDNYAIIPSNALFSELVRTALNKLGYSSTEALAAKGAIQLKNWKPLNLDQITESPEATVGDILGELSTIATLRIRLYNRPKPHSANDVKEKLLQVLLAQSQNLLISSGCPIDQVGNVLAALTKGRLECDIPDDTRKKFDQWYLQQVFQHCRQVALLQQQQQQQQHQHIQHHHSHHAGIVAASGVEAIPLTGSPPHPSPPELVSRVSIVGQGRTRIRTSFDPELELPKLHRWFAENQHPSRIQIQQYVRELNSLESRRGRKPLDVNNVVYWFKNARAAHKRAEQKCCSESNGIRSPCGEVGVESRSLALDQSCRPSMENETERFSGGESHSESQANSSDDSDNVHTLDLSVRRCHDFPILREQNVPQVEIMIKDEPKDSGSEHSIESSDSGEEEVDVEDMNLTVGETGFRGEDFGDEMHQNGRLPGNDGRMVECDPDHQRPKTYPGRVFGRVLGRLEERRKRNRTFIDPVSEVPRLEQWFSSNTHPSHSHIVRFTQELNNMQYRQKFPKLEPKNIQFWFKNRRAKCKRLNLATNLQTISCSEKIMLPAN